MTGDGEEESVRRTVAGACPFPAQRPMPGAAETIRIIRVENDEGAAPDARQFGVGELALLSLPCPGARIRGGIGGQTVTTCTFCGEVMASTAGPHSRDGRWYKPVVCYPLSAGGWVTWQPLHERVAAQPADLAGSAAERLSETDDPRPVAPLEGTTMDVVMITPADRPAELPRFRKVATSSFEWRSTPFDVTTKEGVLHIGPDTPEWEDGYWVAWPDDGDPYPVSPKYFRENYEPVS